MDAYHPDLAALAEHYERLRQAKDLRNTQRASALSKADARKLSAEHDQLSQQQHDILQAARQAGA